MRWLMRWLAPKSTLDFAAKFVLFCALVSLWHVLMTRVLFRNNSESLLALVLEANVSAVPFTFLVMGLLTFQVREIRRLTFRARYDTLSGLLNRQSFFSRFARVLPGVRSGLILLIDVDHFKRVNDKFGHATGDRCIEAIGHRLNWHLRIEDIAGRIGGEEFAVFLPDITREHGRTVAQRLAQPVSFTDVIGQEHLSVTLSVGAVWVDPSKSSEKNLLEADEALYSAKEGGRAQIRYSDGSVQPTVHAATVSPPGSRAIRRQRPVGKVISRWG